MHVTLPSDIWPHIDYDRRHPDGRLFRGVLLPPNGIWIAAWFRQFVRSHHDLPIFWPSNRWLWDNHEISQANQHYLRPACPMTRHAVNLASHAIRLLKARSELDGEPAATILRRLLVQHFGRRPSDPIRVTGGAHQRTPGQGPDCTSCGPMIEMSRS